MKLNNFDDATIAVTLLSRLMGLRKFKESSTPFWFVINYSFKVVVLGVAAFSLWFGCLSEIWTSHFKLERVLYQIVVAVWTAVFFCMLVFSWYHSKDIPSLRKSIIEVEESLLKLGAEFNHRNIFIWLTIACCIFSLNTFISVGICGYWVASGKLKLIYLLAEMAYSYLVNIGGIVLVDFMAYVYWQKFSFKQTNDLLRKFLVEGRQIKIEESTTEAVEPAKGQTPQTPKKLGKWMSKHSLRRQRVAPLKKTPSVKHELQAVKKVHLLQEIRFIHLQLCGITKTINRLFDLQIMLHSSIAVLNLTMNLYYVYMMLDQAADKLSSEIGMILVSLFSTFYNWFRIILVSYVCEYTFREAKKIIEIIHTCSVYDFDTELKDEILQFSLQISLSQMSNSKFHFFSLNYTFIRQCISAVSTYLVIMIQWSQAMEPEILLTKDLSSNTTSVSKE